MRSLVIHPSALIEGEATLPGDKSISHRAMIFAALNDGTTRIQNLLESEDVLRTIEIFRRLGVRITRRGSLWQVVGKGPQSLRPPKGILNCGNSGTTMRLLSGVLSALPFRSRLTGDSSLNRRPMDRVIIPLRRMGADIGEIFPRGRRVILIHGKKNLKPLHYRLPVPSAQVKSAILLAGLVAGVPVKVIEKIKTRDHTERMTQFFRRKGFKRILVAGDISSAAFLIVATLIHWNRKSEVLIHDVGLNPTRTGFLEILRRMGATIEILRRRTVSGEPVGDIQVRASYLKGVDVGGMIVPRLIDEVPILAVAAAVADGRSVFRNLGELRVKESDRIRALVREFARFGVAIQERRDGFVIHGGRQLRGAFVTSHGDHRIAMALAVLGTQAFGQTTVRDVGSIATSFPQFVSLMRGLGARIVTS